jgi:hypothetical protein
MAKQTLYGIAPEQLQKLGNYLVTRPYAEVESLVEALKSLPKIEVNDPPLEAKMTEPAEGEDTKAEV